MKKLSLVATAALVLAAASCKKGSDEGPAAGGFSARTESDGGKTGLDGPSVLWRSGDNILVFDESGDYAKYWPTKGVNTTSAYFEIADGTWSGYNEGDTRHIAMYPCQESNVTCNVETKKIEGFKLPQEQTYAQNSFGDKAFPMFAYTETADLGFRNLCGVLRLSLYDLPWPVTKITVTSSSTSEKLWGSGTVTIGEGGTPTLGALTDGGNSVYLNCGTNGVECKGGKGSPTYFYIVLPAGAFKENGFNVTVECKDGYTKTVTCARANEIERSKVTRMPEKEFYCVDLGLPSGRLWAPCNLGVKPVGGAMSETAYGDYYAWGATTTWYSAKPSDAAGNTSNGFTWKSGKTDGYTWGNAPYQTAGAPASGTATKWSKYIPSGQASYWSGGGSGPDNKLELDAVDDAARVVYGGAWRTPTCEDFAELNSNCTSQWVTEGVQGRKFTSRSNGRSIFFPAAGDCNGTSRSSATSASNYWSRSLSSSAPYDAHALYSHLYIVNPEDNYYRFHGFPVRPVL